MTRLLIFPQFLCEASSKKVEKTIPRLRIRVFETPLDYLRAGKETKLYIKGVQRRSRGISCSACARGHQHPSSLTDFKHYHDPRRLASVKLNLELPDEGNEGIIQAAIHRVNINMGPEQLCSTSSVFGAILRPARCVQAPYQTTPAPTSEATMDTTARYLAQEYFFSHAATIGFFPMSSKVSTSSLLKQRCPCTE